VHDGVDDRGDAGATAGFLVAAAAIASVLGSLLLLVVVLLLLLGRDERGDEADHDQAAVGFEFVQD
jgi:hypothetical protein